MKNFLVLMLISFTFCVSSASAGFISEFEIYNPTEDEFFTAFELDWTSGASAVATGIAAPGEFYVGKEFDFYYQASLTSILGPLPDLAVVTDFNPGLNTEFEYTLVSSSREIISSIDATDPTAIDSEFTVLSGTWAIYISDADSSIPNGTGFDNGTLVASGTVDPGLETTFTLYDAGTPSEIGLAAFRITGLVDDDYNRDYLRSLDEPSIIIDDFLIPIAGLAYPAQGSQTLAYFAPDATNPYYPMYTVNPETDFQFKLDTNNRFSVVPEPSTYILLSMGLIGLVACNRRRKGK